jgi:hygromycin-B 7''-O-kinase
MSRAAWEAFVISRSTACAGSTGHTRRQAVADLNQAAIRFVDEAMQPEKTALLHGDFTGEHLLMRNTNGDWRITGLIDFGDCRIGHPEYDLVTPGLDIMIGEGKCQREMLLGYGFAPSDLTELLREKLTRWSLLHEYIRVPEQPDGRSRLNASDEEIRSLARLLWRF